MILRLFVIVVAALVLTAVPGCKKEEPQSPQDLVEQVQEEGEKVADEAQDAVDQSQK